MEILHLYLSPGHNFFGHHGQPAGQHELVEHDSVECRAGRGLVGDRFFDHKENYKGQITFFRHEIYQSLSTQLNIHDKSPAVFRRNVITCGQELNDWIGREFIVQGVRFFGTEECRPCHWMERAFGPGAETALQGHGGLRARILSEGILRKTIA